MNDGDQQPGDPGAAGTPDRPQTQNVGHRSHIAALLDRLDRLAQAHEQSRAQRNAIAAELGEVTGRTWEQVLADHDVNLQGAADLLPDPHQRHDYRDHDHGAEDALIAYTNDPSPRTAQAAELAVATLQRRYDHLLRRLDGDGSPPAFPVHRHNPAEDPEGCAAAALHDLAGAALPDRAETLAHGLQAVNALARQRDEARRLARRCYEFENVRLALGEANQWAWLTEEDE
ncbi:hypothetical protein EKO23_07765 [Nocardioides guangzhouensis]|uniref:Uncharacterized protein n=1 Tax=Nocardioides guangzhouensis TaxID=2497878 RepID=A0A4Q4ZH95_9ACTN|nr:hypothetical protein [Nocardioides guangzhouensis]RYP86861.1 hypothetical protein EKO23_07765 [Nocardioides guangzhouensis]